MKLGLLLIITKFFQNKGLVLILPSHISFNFSRGFRKFHNPGFYSYSNQLYLLFRDNDRTEHALKQASATQLFLIIKNFLSVSLSVSPGIALLYVTRIIFKINNFELKKVSVLPCFLPLYFLMLSSKDKISSNLHKSYPACIYVNSLYIALVNLTDYLMRIMVEEQLRKFYS